jgi:hypothetical protein
MKPYKSTRGGLLIFCAPDEGPAVPGHRQKSRKPTGHGPCPGMLPAKSQWLGGGMGAGPVIRKIPD